MKKWIAFRPSRPSAGLAALTALGRFDEFDIHVPGGIINGLSAEEIEEIMLTAAAYLGFPTAVEATRKARGLLAANS